MSVRDAVFAPEAVIGSMDEEKKRDMAPELLITIGGAPISAGLKNISGNIILPDTGIWVTRGRL